MYIHKVCMHIDFGFSFVGVGNKTKKTERSQYFFWKATFKRVTYVTCQQNKLFFMFWKARAFLNGPSKSITYHLFEISFWFYTEIKIIRLLCNTSTNMWKKKKSDASFTFKMLYTIQNFFLYTFNLISYSMHWVMWGREMKPFSSHFLKKQTTKEKLNLSYYATASIYDNTVELS